MARGVAALLAVLVRVLEEVGLARRAQRPRVAVAAVAVGRAERAHLARAVLVVVAQVTDAAAAALGALTHEDRQRAVRRAPRSVGQHESLDRDALGCARGRVLKVWLA